jgi:hypothetical protein
MEHIVQFAIGIDDETVRQRVLENAEKTIIKNIEDDVKKAIFEKQYYGTGISNNVQTWVKNVVEHVIWEHKDQIVAGAIKELAANLSRTKVAREALKETVGGKE